MAENTQGIGGAVDPAQEEEKKFKSWLKEKYQIEDDPDTFTKKRQSWSKAEEELPQYQATLTQLIQHIKDQQAAQAQGSVQHADEDDEESLRQLARTDPYEGTKRLLSRFEKNMDDKLTRVTQRSAELSEVSVMRREGLRRAHELVTQNWPEAFDQKTDLHKMGKQIFRQEMSQDEQLHPMAFLIATERAAGRLGVAPRSKRGSTSRRDVSAQSVSRDKVKVDTSDLDEKPLTPRQKQIASGVGVDPKVYKEAMKIRREQSKKQDDE